MSFTVIWSELGQTGRAFIRRLVRYLDRYPDHVSTVIDFIDHDDVEDALVAIQVLMALERLKFVESYEYHGAECWRLTAAFVTWYRAERPE